MGAIRDIDLNANGTIIASTGDDKTVKLWSTESGQLIKTLRVPITNGDAGKLYAVSLDKAGEWVAAAGATSGELRSDIGIYVLDTVSGAILQRISNLPQVVLGLCSSRDGRFLAATLGGANGLRVYDAKSNFQEVFSDPGYKGNSYGCDFDATGNLVTSSYDGKIRLYQNNNASYTLKSAIESAAGKRPFSIKFNMKGDRIAVGFSDLPVLEVRDGGDLSLLFKPDTLGLDNGSLSQVAWANDDRRLYAGARYKDSEGIRQLMYWDRFGRASPQSWAVSEDSILAIESTQTGRIVLGTAAKSLLIFDGNGNKLVEQISTSADMRGKFGKNFLISDDGSTVSFSLDLAGNELVSFDSAKRRINFARPKLARQARTTSNAVSVDNWLNSRTPSINDVSLELEKYDVSRSLSIDKGDRHFLLGTEHSLKYFEISGKLIWESDVPATAWGVNIAENNKLGVVAYGDGSIRWHRLSDGQLLLSLFVYNEGRDWVLWSQSGYYDASPGADRLIGWHKNNGATQKPDFFLVNQLRHRFYRPDIISKILTTLDETKAINLVFTEAERKATEKEAAEQIAAEQIAAEQIAAEQIAAEKIAAEKIAAEKIAAEKIAAEKIAAEKIAAEKIAAEKIAVEKIAAEKIAAEKIAAEKNAAGELLAVAKPIAESLPPVVTVLSPSNGTRFSKSELTLRYQIKSDVQVAANKISILVDGRPLKRERGLSRGQVKNQVIEKKITLPKKDLTLTVIVENGNGVSSPSTVRLVWDGDKKVSEGRPRLFVLAAGVSDYQHKDIPDLEYAVKDAVDFKEVISTQAKKGLYQDVIVKALEDPTAEEVRQALRWLEKEVTRNDVAMFYIAGHGLNDDQKQYFFITNETDPYNLEETALSYKDIRQTLINLPSKTIAFVDTCQSGNALGNDILSNDLNGVVNDLSATENGVIVFTSSTSSQPSLELTSIKNGVFTHSILEGLRDGGTIDRFFTKDGQLTFKELDLHISNRVRELTNNKQNPTLVTPNDAADYVIANVKVSQDQQ